MEAEAKRLAALKEELRKDMEALERVERLMASKNGSLSRPDDRQMPLPISRETVDSEEDEDNESPITTLTGKIAEIINANPETRWTAQKVLAQLIQAQFPLKAKKPIYSVGQTLQKLVEKKKIRVVRKGVGSAPNIYKGLASAAQNSAGTEGDSQGWDIVHGSSMTE